MSAHRAVIEAGPGTIRRLCCGTGSTVDAEVSLAALDAIDDPVALVDERPIAVDSLWSDVLRSLTCGHRDGLTVVHPSWWSAPRVGVLTRAARTLADDAGDIEVHPRSWLLTQASEEATVMVEIADRLVVVAGDEVVAVPRRTEPVLVAEEVAGVIAGMVAGMTRGTESVVVDVPSTVAGAPALATWIAGAVRDSCGGQAVVEVDDARLARLARDEPCAPLASRSAGGSRSRAHRPAGLAAAGVVLTVLGVAVEAVVGRHGAAPGQVAPTTFLVEGRVALTVPADWPTQRVVAGPGSARVQVTSPADPEVALHVTQSPVAGETLTGTAERLKRAIDAEPAGVFVDFNPSGISAGRPAVTYREVRAGHDVRWTVLLDGAVRISVGCQSRPGAEDAVRDVCEQAVRSARAVG